MAIDDSPGKIDDPEDTSQTERIKSILRRREEVLEARDRAKDQYYLSDSAKLPAVMHYQSRLETLIVDLRNKFRHELLQAETDYWDGVEIATVTVPPPDTLTDNDALAPGESEPDPERVTIRGLSWFIPNKPLIVREFTVNGWNPPRELSDTGEIVLGFDVIDEGVMTCFDFMETLGIDADLSPEPYMGGEEPGI